MTQECPIDGMDCECPDGQCKADPTGEIQRACKGGVVVVDQAENRRLAAECAASLLRAAGWTVLPPPGEAIPEPQVRRPPYQSVTASAMAATEQLTTLREVIAKRKSGARPERQS